MKSDLATTELGFWLLKEILKDLNNWRDILCSLVGRLNTVKIPVLLKVIYTDLNIPQNPSKAIWKILTR